MCRALAPVPGGTALDAARLSALAALTRLTHALLLLSERATAGDESAAEQLTAAAELLESR